MSRPHHIVWHSLILLLHLVKTDWHSVAVVEYQTMNGENQSPQEFLERSVDQYVEIIHRTAANNNLIAIVFPEGTLDNVKEYKDLKPYSTKITPSENPCFHHKKKYPEYMRRLSCAAIYYETFVIFNVIEEHGYNYYTSDVVLNIAGHIEFSIRREHRIGVDDLRRNPIAFAVPIRYVFYFMEFIKGMFSLVVPFTVTSFVTGFSFSFEKVIHTKQYRNYLICSNWVSQLPFLTSLQVYQMWAQEFNITVFFSGANNPKKGQGGTGVYHDTEGPVLMDILPFGGTKVYLYNLTNVTFEDISEHKFNLISSEMDNFHIEVDPDLHRYKSVTLDLRKQQTQTEVCYNKTPGNNFCCQFQLNFSSEASLITSKTQYTYHLVAYKGYKTYYKLFEPGGVEICALIACLDSSLDSCGKRFESFEKIQWPVTFHKIVIKAKFSLPQKENIYFSSQFPNSLLSSIRPIHPKFTEWTKQNITEVNGNVRLERLERTFTLIKPHKKILTFGIFGRNFTLHDPRGSSCKCSTHQHLVLITICFNFLSMFVS